ncbi:MAG: hypothetical protein ACPG4T_22880, partial [Nannocystaceae bacterium]
MILFLPIAWAPITQNGRPPSKWAPSAILTGVSDHLGRRVDSDSCEAEMSPRRLARRGRAAFWLQGTR